MRSRFLLSWATSAIFLLSPISIVLYFIFAVPVSAAAGQLQKEDSPSPVKGLDARSRLGGATWGLSHKALVRTPGRPQARSMAKIGRRNILWVARIATPGVYLDGGERGEILLPGRYVPKGTIVGESFDVFVHRDSEDRLVATTETPRALVGEFAALRVVSADPRIGAFLDWGLSKDLLLPIREQSRRVNPGEWVVAYVFVDVKTDRIVATTRLNRHLNVT